MPDFAVVSTEQTIVRVAREMTVVSREPQPIVVVSRPATVIKVMAGEKGDKGDDGAVAGAIEVEAGEDISALKPIVIIEGLAYVADSSNPAHFGKLVGISLTAADEGEEIRLAVEGTRVVDSFFNFVDGGLIFVGAAGTLVLATPATNFIQVVAVAIDSDALVVQIGDPIRRS